MSAVQRLMADGYGFGGEGDWKTAALLAAVKEMGGSTNPDGPRGSSFMEDYTYHFGPGEPKILGAHMLEVCPTIAAATPTCEIHPLGIGDREDPVRLVFDAAPGPATVIGIVDMVMAGSLGCWRIEPPRSSTERPGLEWRFREIIGR